MSRHTHVTDPHRHDRGEVRRQKVRHARRHWRAGKRQIAAHTLEFHLDGPEAARIAPECIEQLKSHLGHNGPVLYLQPEQMRRMPADLRRCFEPFSRQRTELRAPQEKPLSAATKRRTREKRFWQAEASVDAQLTRAA